VPLVSKGSTATANQSPGRLPTQRGPTTCSRIGKHNNSVTFLLQRDEDICLIDSERKEYLYENDNFNNQ
jgi:hypothetical protein